MSSDAALADYLNDHLAGAMMGVGLAESCRTRHEGTELGDHLTGLVDEIEADRETLQRMMAALGVERSAAKKAAGWVTEKLSRVALAPPVTGSAEASAVLQIEALSLGIEGKLCLWSALRVLAGSDRFAGEDLGLLAERARTQREGLERRRLELAADSLAPPPAA